MRIPSTDDPKSASNVLDADNPSSSMDSHKLIDVSIAGMLPCIAAVTQNLNAVPILRRVPIPIP
jgi:hypothetical protein